MAGCYERPSDGRGGTVVLAVTEHAGIENLKMALEEVVTRVGTIECGIGGWQLEFRTDRESGYPSETEEISPGVHLIKSST